jgi:hypothetical protein
VAVPLWPGHRALSSNFGRLGTAPTHPELLDWLASEFVQQGWRLKPLHKMIVMSSAYRMSAKAEPKALAKDPENDLLWRFDMRRLAAEEVRDSILAVNNSLNKAQFGPPVYPTIPPKCLPARACPAPAGASRRPRSRPGAACTST